MTGGCPLGRPAIGYRPNACGEGVGGLIETNTYLNFFPSCIMDFFGALVWDLVVVVDGGGVCFWGVGLEWKYIVCYIVFFFII